MQEIQEPILRQAHYENVPIYSLDELEELSRKERIEAEQRLVEAVRFRQEAEAFARDSKANVESIVMKYGEEILKPEYRSKHYNKEIKS